MAVEYDPLDTEPRPAEPSDEQKLIQQALEHWKEADDADAAQREIRRADLRFALGDSDNMWQWEPSMVQMRQAPGTPPRPCITDNRLAGQIRQVTNEQRQNKPAIKARPVDDKADLEVAKIYDGIIRAIEDRSDADVAYQKAADYQTNAGLGFFRILTKYTSPDSFDQEILIAPIPDPDSVRMDPFIKHPDGLDQRYCFIHDDLPKSVYEATYGDLPSGDWQLGNAAWTTTDTVRVAEYFCIKHKTFTLYRLPDGAIVTELSEQMQSLLGPEPDAKAFEALGIQTRESETHDVHWYKLTSFKVLEHSIFESVYVPVLRVVGEEWRVDGECITKGMVRNAKDPQRMVNYYTSNEAETIAQQPRAPYVAARGQVENFQEMWDQANTAPVSVLVYDAVAEPVTGQLLPPPARQPPPMMPPAFVQGKLGAIDSLKAATNVYDASLGQRSNETSGVAIQRRDIQQETSNFHYIDNLARAIKHAGRIIVDMIPRIYTGKQVANILGEDGSESIALLQWGDTPAMQRNRDGKKVYNLGVGRYDVTVTVGPSFSTKRQEAGAFMTEVVRASPQLMAVAGDIIMGSLDVPGADRLAARLKKTLPPNLLEEEDADEKQQLQQAKAMIAQMEQALQNADNIATGLQKERDTAVSEAEKAKGDASANLAKVEIERDKVAMEQAQMERDRELEQQKLSLEEQKAAAEARREAEMVQIEADKLALEQSKMQLEHIRLSVDQRAAARAAALSAWGGSGEAMSPEAQRAAADAVREAEMAQIEAEKLAFEQSRLQLEHLRIASDERATAMAIATKANEYSEARIGQLSDEVQQLTSAMGMLIDELHRPKPVQAIYSGDKIVEVVVGDKRMQVARNADNKFTGLH